MQKNKIYLIKWLDHTGNSGWVTDLKDEEPAECLTIGWLVEETKKSYKLADTQSGNMVAGLSVIIKSCILEVWEIDFYDEKRKKTPRKSS